MLSYLLRLESQMNNLRLFTLFLALFQLASVSSIDITECPNTLKISKTTATQIKATLEYTTQKTEKNWNIQLVLDKSVKKIKVLLTFQKLNQPKICFFLQIAGYSVKSNDKRVFTIKPIKNKNLKKGTKLKLNVIISHIK